MIKHKLTKTKKTLYCIIGAVLLGLLPLMSACSGSLAPQKDTAELLGDESYYSFTIMSNDGGNAYASQANQDDRYYDGLSRLFSDYIGKETRVQFDFLSSYDYSKQVNVRFASSDMPEVLATTSISDKGHPTAVENGIFMELNQLIDEFGPHLKEKIPPYVWENPRISKDGKIYGIPKMLNPPALSSLYVRQDWLDQLEMDRPETLNEFLDFFEAVKNNDLNGNGDPHDEIGYPVRARLGFSGQFFVAFGVLPGIWHEVNGQFIPDIINPNMKRAVAFYKKLYDNGYINRDFLNTKAADWVDYIHSGRAATWSHDLRNIGVSWAPENFDDSSSQIGLLPGIKAADGSFRLNFQGLGVAKVFVITKNTSQPERIIQFLDWTYSDDPAKNNFFAFGIEGHNYQVESGAIKWDANSPINTKEQSFYQTLINPSGDARLDPGVLKGNININLLEKGLEYVEHNMYDNPSMNMPSFDVLETNKALGTGADSLFLDMFARVVSGKSDIDTAFSAFVTEWKQGGGAEAIRQATAWYKENQSFAASED